MRQCEEALKSEVRIEKIVHGVITSTQKYEKEHKVVTEAIAYLPIEDLPNFV